MFSKKKKVGKTKDSKIILGMVMLGDHNSFKIDTFINDFKNHYKDNIQEPAGDDNSFVFKTDSEMVAIGYMPVPIPLGDIEGTAQYAYNWQTAMKDTKEHKSHLIVSVMHGGQDQIKRFKIFTHVLCSLLRTTNAIGVYKGNQSLLIPKDDYLSEAEFMSSEYLPLNLWVYFGLRVTDKGNSCYTYGLREFGKIEMEVVDSSKSVEDVRAFLFNIAHYIMDYDVSFQDGQTVGVSDEEKISISFSKGQFVDGDTFKFAY